MIRATMATEGAVRVPLPVKPVERDRAVVEDLFVEQDVEVLALSYRHGLLRSLFILARSLLFARAPGPRLADAVASGTSVAVVFFRNELQAASSAPEALRADRIVHIDLRALGCLRQQLGATGLARETLRFAGIALGLKGWRYLGRLTQPLFGWLLYRTFQSLLQDRHDVTVITTNMVHPASIGVAWAAATTNHASEYFEHATTTRVGLRDRGYRHVYVNFPHTRQMLAQHGFDPARVHVLRDIAAAERPPGEPIRKVGLCINTLDSLEAIRDVTEVLHERSLEVVYRVHDADPRLAQLRRLATQRSAGLSEARRSGIDAFLDTVDLIVAGNSNVIADALIAGRRAIYYWSGNPELFDYYGLVGHYRVPHARSKDALRGVVAYLLGGAAPC